MFHEDETRGRVRGSRLAEIDVSNQVLPLSEFATLTGIPAATVLRAAERGRIPGLVVRDGGIVGVDMVKWRDRYDQLGKGGRRKR